MPTNPLETTAPHASLQDCAFTLAFTGEGAAAFVVTGGWPAMTARYRMEVFGIGAGEPIPNTDEWQGTLENLADLDECWVNDEDGIPLYFHQEIGEISQVTIYRLSSDLQPVTAVTHHALAELVELKDLRDSLPADDDIEDTEIAARWVDYRQRKLSAWRYARAILGAESHASAVRRSAPWRIVERICDAPEVDQAIRNLLEDQTGDNAAFMVRAVLDALGPQYVAAAAEQRPDLRHSAIDVLAERTRQIVILDRDAKHDDTVNSPGDLARAAAAYSLSAGGELKQDSRPPSNVPPACWPWGTRWWNPKTAREDLVRAGALVLAELDRIDRAS